MSLKDTISGSLLLRNESVNELCHVHFTFAPRETGTVRQTPNSQLATENYILEHYNFTAASNINDPLMIIPELVM